MKLTKSGQPRSFAAYPRRWADPGAGVTASESRAKEAADGQSANIRVPPGVYFLLGLVVGFGVELFLPIPVPVAPLLSTTIGASVLVAGIGLFAVARWTLGRARTPIDPMKPSTALVTSGVYGLSRNPLYLGALLMYCGIGIAGRSIVSLALLPAVLAAIRLIVIQREEEYLRRVFGVAYDEYCGRVRRWV
jgi:protein-S-isoprenylcysteine O-methyltransferase Ste14